VAADPPIDPQLAARMRAWVRRELRARVETLDAIPGQLGARRFYRVHLAGGPAPTLIARVDRPEDPRGRPPGTAAEPPLEPIRALLERSGCPVPRRFGADSEFGIEWLEDVGDVSLAQAVADAPAEARRRLYAEACGIVAKIQDVADPGDVAAFGRRLDPALFAFKADLFTRFALRAGGRHPGQGEAAVVAAAFARVEAACAEAPHRLAHRDFQSANLHCVPGRGLVMIDLQGAFLAPPEYDLVCLLRDSYVTLPEAEITAQCDAIRERLPDAPSAEDFARRFDLLTLTRKGKDLARFHQAAEERGDRRYLRYAAGTLRHIAAAAERAAQRDSPLRDFATLCRELEAAPCAE